MSELFTNVICTAAFVMASAALVIQIALLLKERREEREEREREERDALLRSYHRFPRFPHPAPKPDAAKECGVVPPKFDEQPRRKGMKKVLVFIRDGYVDKFFDLAEFYRIMEVRKCDFSPSRKMNEDERIALIATKIIKFYRERGTDVCRVSLYRKKRWHSYASDTYARQS